MEMGAVGHGRTNVTIVCNTRSWGSDEQCCKSRPGITCHCRVSDQRIMQINNDGHFTVKFHPI